MHYKQILFPIFILLATSCSNEGQLFDKKTTVNLKDLDTLQASRIITADSLYSPSNLTLIGDKVVIVDNKASRPVLLYDYEKELFLGRYGNTGKGPGEFNNSWALISKDSTIYNYDPGLRRITKMNLSQDSIAISGNHHTIRDGGYILSMDLLSDKQFISTGFYSDKLLAEFSLNKSPIDLHQVGTEIPADTSLPQKARQSLWRSSVAASPDAKRIALAVRKYSLVHIYNFEADLLHRISIPEQIQPQFEITKNAATTMQLKKGSKLCYTDITTSDNHIYALYSGQDHKAETANFGRYVFKIDWNGNYINGWKLDRNVYKIKYHRNDLFAVKVHKMPEVLRYDI